MKTRKQWIAMLLMLAMLMTALPIAAFAEGSEGKRHVWLTYAYMASDTLGRYDYPIGQTKAKQFDKTSFEAFKGLEITVQGETGEPHTVEKRFFDYDGVPSDIYLLRDCGEWPVGTVLTITIKTAGVSAPYHLSYNPSWRSGYHWQQASDEVTFQYTVVAEDPNQPANRPEHPKSSLCLFFSRLLVKFDPAEGKIGDSDAIIEKSVNPDFSVDFPQDPTRDGYEFKGWYKESTGGQSEKVEKDHLFSYSGEGYPSQATMTLKAKWEKNPEYVTVTFDTGEGTKIPSVQVEKGKTVDKPTTDPTREGYTFKGWKDSLGADFNFTTAINENITLTAKWEENSTGGGTPGGSTGQDEIEITLDPSQGKWEDNTTTPRKITKTVGESTKLPTPTREGHTFVKWQGQTAEVLPGADYTVLKGETRFTAVWKKNTSGGSTPGTTPGGNTGTETPGTPSEPSVTYEWVIFEANGGAWANGDTKREQRVPVGRSITIEAAPIREGYQFLYWKGSEYHPGESYTVPDGGHTFVAQWEKVEKKPEDKPSVPSVDSKIKTPRGSILTADEIAKILAGSKKVIPAIPRAGVGR